MAAIDETTPWIDRLCTALGVLVDYFRENRTMLTAAFHVATRETPQIDGREAVWLYNAYLSLLEDGIAAGEFRQVPADATVRLLINAYTTAALGIGTWAGRGDDPKLMAELDELVRGLVLKPLAG